MRCQERRCVELRCLVARALSKTIKLVEGMAAEADHANRGLLSELCSVSDGGPRSMMLAKGASHPYIG